MCSFIFLMDEDMLVPMMMSDAFDGVFLPVSEWADGEVGEDVLYKAEGEDIAYAVNLKNSKILKDASVPCENMYAAICVNNKDKLGKTDVDVDNGEHCQNVKKLSSNKVYFTDDDTHSLVNEYICDLTAINSLTQK